MNTPLRPMSTSEVLDRTFHLYRNHFLLFCGIAALPPAMLMILKLSLLAVAESKSVGIGAIIYIGLIVLLGVLTFLIGHALATGASVYAVSLVHLERPATIRESYKKVRSMLGRILNVVISVFLRSIGIPALLFLVVFGLLFGIPGIASRRSPEVAMAAGFAAFFFIAFGALLTLYLYARYSLAVPACVLENVPARQAIRRSSALTKGSILRILLVYILAGIISMALAYLLLSPTIILVAMNAASATASKGQVNPVSTPILLWNYIGEFLASAIAGPIATIAIALVYYDERIRKEAFDLQYMMEAIDGAQPERAATTAG